jgi:broad specificity phosphatase PhoE
MSLAGAAASPPTGADHGLLATEVRVRPGNGQLAGICQVRHGETAWSLSGQHTGLTELELTAHGAAESAALAPRLRSMAFTQVLVSPRLRASQTCALAGFAAESRVEPDLCEWDYGRYEGLRSADIGRDRPGWNLWRDGCPDGESPDDVSARADRVLARLGAMRGLVLLFTHGQFGAALAARWIGLAVREGQHFPLQAASVSVLGIDPHHPDRNTIALWNEHRGGRSEGGLQAPADPALQGLVAADEAASPPERVA